MLFTRELKIIKTIFFRQLLLSWINKFELVQNLAFFIVSVLTFKIATGIASAEIYLILLLFSLSLSFNDILMNDYKAGFIQQFIILKIDLFLYLFTKLLSYILCVGCPFIFLILFFNYLITGNIPNIMDCMLLLFIIINIYAANLFSAATCLTSKQNTLSILITLQFSVPTMIFASMSLENNNYAFAVLGLGFIELPIFFIASKFIIEGVIEYN